MPSKKEKYFKTLPRIYKPGINPVITALIEAFASTDEEVVNQIENTKAQLFVRTANGKYLDRLANSLGVRRPIEVGLQDDKFQELIPNLSLKAKQLRKSLYDTADVFWGPLFSRANVTSLNFSTWNVSSGDEIIVSIDSRPIQKVKILSNDLETPGAATSEEMVKILSRIDGVTVSIINDVINNTEAINIRTNTPGPRGSVEIFSDSTMLGVTKFDILADKYELLNQDQRVMIYEINPNEITIELPAIVPSVRRSLKGSHHFHEDETLEAPVAPANGIWQGSFIFDSEGSEATFNVTSQRTVIEEPLTKGDVFVKVTVGDTNLIENQTGTLIFGWGTESQEVGIRYRGIPNSKTILLDPSYQFKKDHQIGEYVNVLADQSPLRPRKNGNDYAIYFTSGFDARLAVQEILKTIVAAGIIVNFVILAPDYKYIIDNPFLESDDSPNC